MNFENHRFDGLIANAHGAPSRWIARMKVLLFLSFFARIFGPQVLAAEVPAAAAFRQDVQPILAKYCSDCHADGMSKGGIAFDQFKSDQELLAKHDLWSAVLKNVRAGLMPPEKKPRPSAGEVQTLERWIKYQAFSLDAKNPDPGRITIRRLNRVEYQNTVRDLLGVDFRAEEELPADDAGYGFDNIGDVLTVSPMLLEKYLQAAGSIVGEAVPTVSKILPETIIGRNGPRRPGGRGFGNGAGPRGFRRDFLASLSFYKPGAVTNYFRAPNPGTYRVILELGISGSNGFDPSRALATLSLDGQETLKQEFGRTESNAFRFEFAQQWKPGEHELAFELAPTTQTLEQNNGLEMRIVSIKVQGSMEQKFWDTPRNYSRFFPRPPPATRPEKYKYAQEILRNFATRAYRGPVDQKSLDRLASLAERFYSQPKNSFEAGVAHAMVAVLASPRFLFREERAAPNSSGPYPLVDEYSLASRLSYFLWSSMPDEELFRLAGRGELRKNLDAQVKRMLADRKSEALVQNFAGQWLQIRDLPGMVIEPRRIMDQETLRLTKLDNDREYRALRSAMRLETETFFKHIVREDRNVLEFIDSDYTFLNGRLARYYGISNVIGEDFRQVTLPKNSLRGGVLTHGTVLLVTSNPTRTSPVKRGLFILDNIMGIPPPPPPPDVPALEAARREFNRVPTLREMLEFHRSKPLCSSCHNRMDPLGLAMENFNALGMVRETERGRPIDTTGHLITGESFANVRDVKRLLVSQHSIDFYRCLTEKLLTYALGRGLEYYDVETVDQIVERLQNENGRFSAVLMGVIESSAFQKRRDTGTTAKSVATRQSEEAIRSAALSK